MSLASGSKFAQLASVLLRLLFACIVAAPISLFSISALVGFNQDWLNPFDHVDSLVFWTLMLWVAAVVAGLPTALFVVKSVETILARFFAIVGIGTVLAAVFSMPFGMFGFPAGAVTAVLCFLFNYNLLKQESFAFLGKVYGPQSGE